MANYPSERPEIELGAATLDAVRAVAGNDGGPARPFTFAEAWLAAETVHADVPMPREVVVSGIVLDMMPGHLAPRRAVLARRLRIRPDTLQSCVALWETVDDHVRFAAVAAAVRVARVRRIGGGACRG